MKVDTAGNIYGGGTGGSTLSRALRRSGPGGHHAPADWDACRRHWCAPLRPPRRSGRRLTSSPSTAGSYRPRQRALTQAFAVKDGSSSRSGRPPRCAARRAGY
jgi:hypothetical protein